MASDKPKIKRASISDLKEIEINIHNFNMPSPRNYKLVKHANHEITFIAWSGKQIIGFISMVPKASEKTLEVVGLYLKTGHDDQGIGTRLTNMAKAFAKREKYGFIKLYPGGGVVVRRNKLVEKKSHPFYDKMGFRWGVHRERISHYLWEVPKRKIFRKKP